MLLSVLPFSSRFITYKCFFFHKTQIWLNKINYAFQIQSNTLVTILNLYDSYFLFSYRNLSSWTNKSKIQFLYNLFCIWQKPNIFYIISTRPWDFRKEKFPDSQYKYSFCTYNVKDHVRYWHTFLISRSENFTYPYCLTT